MAAPEYTAANVESAVLQFYYQGASQEIHQWLTNAQMSQAAWNFAWELLMTEKKPEVQFFGASTIAIKVSKFWPEVPEDQVHTLVYQIILKNSTYRAILQIYFILKKKISSAKLIHPLYL